jgi:predicted DNA-binding transcriptional regulator YafY
MSLAQIADALQVTPRSARRYLRELQREYDLDKVAVGSAAPLWRLSAEDRPRRVALRRAQSYALLAARGLFEPLRGSALFEEIDLANKAILAVARRPGRGPNAGVADAGLEDRFAYVPKGLVSYSHDIESLDVLYHCVSDLRPMACRWIDDSGNPQNVTILPYAMVFYDDSIFAVGKLEPDSVVRVFPIEKILDASASDVQHFEVPPNFSLNDYVQGSFGLWNSQEKCRVVIDFSPESAPQIRNRRIHSTQKLSALRGGGLRLTMTLGQPEKVAPWVLGFGDGARVVEPEALRSLVIQKLKGAVSLYRDRSGV